MKTMFSVIVPIYKVESYLKKCVDSILKQTYADFELILVDDGSPDNCPKICDNYAIMDPRVRVIHKKNGGLISARNTGVLAANGEYICYVDGDDWIKENLLEKVFEAAIKPYGPDMVVFSAVRKYNTVQEEIPNRVEEGLYDKERLNKELYPFMMYDNRLSFCTGLVFPVAWNKIFRTELLKEHYCEEERIRMGEDNAFVYECMYYAKDIYFCSEVLYFYNQENSGSMTKNYDEDRFDNNRILCDYIEGRLGGKTEVMDAQINAFKVYWLIMAVFHEIKCGRPLFQAAKHINEKITSTYSLKGITPDGLPKSAQIYLVLLKFKMYIPALIAAKIVNNKRSAK